MSPAVIFAVVVALLFSLFGMTRSVEAVAVTAGYRDHSYGTGVDDPTEDKPQSKVWFADGSWWAGMFVDGSDDNRIHRYNPTTHVWTATSTVVDARNGSHGDYLWDGSALYVASVNGDTDPGPILVFKFTYSAASDTYTLDPDFRSNQDADPELEAGLIAGQGPAETVTIAKDSTGQLWITYQNPVDADNRKVMVNRSIGPEHAWGTAFQIGTEIGADDISAIIAYGAGASASVGVMYSERLPGGTQSSFRFASHLDSAADTAFTLTTAATDTAAFAEDHINLKLTATGSGTVIAAVKTTSGPNDIQLLRRPSSGPWTRHPVVSGEDVTRPQIVVDETNARAYVFYTHLENPSDGDQAIYYKSAPLSSLSFTTAGLGTAFIQDGTNDINNVATAKHNVNAATDLVAIASSDTNTSYYHGFLAIPGTSVPATPTGLTATAVSSSQINLSWNASPGATSYRVYRNGALIASPTGTSFSNTGLAPGTTYSYRVAAVNAAGASAQSAAVTATTQSGGGGGGGGHPFTDISGHLFENDIIWLYNSRITSGCTATRFCPNSPVTRQQMASFLVRAYELPATSRDFFADDEGSVHEADINRLAASGITGGCGPGRFCPTREVTRQQMASFLARAERLPAASRDFFTDDEASIHEADINRLAASGITGGCGGTRFCPTQSVTRGQMAAFLRRALTN